MGNKLGVQTMQYKTPPYVVSSAAVVGDVEGQGPLGSYFDQVLEDDMWGEESWEKAERKMFEQSVRKVAYKTKLELSEVDCLLGDDLLNQIISANFAARELNIPFLGLYGACSTMAESLLIGGMLMDTGFAKRAACVAASHFSTAERQYRMPLEMGVQPAPTTQRTATGAGCSILSDQLLQNAQYRRVRVTHGTIGRVVDLGITDAANMGAAMAPAAADTLLTHFKDTGRSLRDYDLIVTGDLGSFGSDMFKSLCEDAGVRLGDRHQDCGNMIFHEAQKVVCGGSGCGCSASVLNGYLLKRIKEGDFSRVLFIATGALMSTTSGMQNDSIPGIAHAVVLERV